MVWTKEISGVRNANGRRLAADLAIKYNVITLSLSDSGSGLSLAEADQVIRSFPQSCRL